MDEFAASAAALSSPFTHPHTRRAADRWLTRFQSSPDAWAISQQVLASPADPRLRLLAAQVFAHKVKRQLDEVAGEGQRHALLDATAAQVAAAAACGEAALARALSVALAHLMLQCPGAARPLERVSGLGQAALLQFFTILADEAEGAVAAAVAASGEAAFELRQRVRGWGAEVCGWLRDVLAAALYAPANLAAMPRPPGGVHEAVLLSGGPARAATAEVARCFAAWVKWGALDSSQVDPGPGAHLLQAASALLFLGEHDPALAELGVDAVLEAVEHAPEASQAALAALALRLPGHVASLAARGADAGQLAHVFACFCSTHAALAASSGPEGAALRAGLLLLLGLPLQGGAGTAASAALDGVSDVLEAAAGAGLGRGEACESAIMDPEAAEQFAAAVLGVLLRQLELPESSFAGSAIAAAAAAGDEEGGPEALRLQAEVAVELCAQQLSPEGLMPRLQAAAQAAAAQHGAPSLPATRAADCCLYITGAAAGAFLEILPTSGSPPPAWAAPLLALYAAVSELDGSRHRADAPTTALHYDLLSSFAALAPALMPALAHAPRDVSQALTHLIVTQAMRALSSRHLSRGAGAGGQPDARDAAADAVRALCSFGPAAGLAASPQLLEALDSMLELLQSAPYRRHYRPAAQQLTVAVVHAAHASTDGAAALTLARRRCFAVLEDAVRALQRAVQGGIDGSSAVQAATDEVQAALQQVQAMLNAFESYADGQQGGADDGHAVARAVRAATMDGFLGTWTALSHSCAMPSVGEALFAELSLCLCSCMALDSERMQGGMERVLPALCAPFFAPGGHVLHRVLVAAAERYGEQPALQPTLLATLGAVLDAPPARPFLQLRGGDADPPLALALLSVATCGLREAARWRAVPPPAQAAALALAELALRLAAACAPCTHRDVAQRGIAALSAAMLLALERDGPLHAGALELARRQVPLVLQALVLSLASLSAASHLPKAASLMGDVALLAAACAGVAPGQGEGEGEAAAGRVMQVWLVAAREGLVGGGALPAAAADALLSAWDWRPALQQAALCAAQSPAAAGVAGVRRASQRAVRQLGEAARAIESSLQQSR